MFDDFGSKFETAISSKIGLGLQAGQNENRKCRDSTEEENGYGYGVEDTAIKIGPFYRGKLECTQKFRGAKESVKEERMRALTSRMSTPDGKKICPFCEFTCTIVPQAVYKKMKREWQPMLRKMENTPSLPALDDVNQIVTDLIFNLDTEHLKQHVCGFIFNNKKAD